MLGFDHAIRTGAFSYYYYYYYYYYRPRQIWLDDVQCTGNESSIEQCSFPGWGIEDCYYWDDVSVACDCECVCVVVCYARALSIQQVMAYFWCLTLSKSQEFVV